MITSMVLISISLICPNYLMPLNKIWSRIGNLIGEINNKIILAFLYYFIITPSGKIMQLFTEDPMSRKMEYEKDTYFVKVKRQASGVNFKNMF